MAKEFAKPFYNSASWQAARRAYINHRIAIDGGLCETCKEVPGTIVHHIKSLNEKNISMPDVTLSFDNLRLDCKKCHDEEEDHFIKRKKTRCAFDASGQPMPPLFGKIGRCRPDRMPQVKFDAGRVHGRGVIL